MGLFKGIKKVTSAFTGSAENEEEIIQEDKTEIKDAKQLKKERNKKIDEAVDEGADLINEIGEMADDLFDIGIPGVGFLGKTAAKIGIKTAIKGGKAVSSVASSAGQFVDKNVLTDKNKEMAKKGGKMAVSAATTAKDYVGKKVFTDKNKEKLNKGLKGLKSFLSQD